MSELKGACIIGQSGGPTSVINASAYGVIDTALKNPNITRVLGAEHGIKGVLNDRLFDMGQEDPAELELLKYTHSSALGSCRYKMKDPDEKGLALGYVISAIAGGVTEPALFGILMRFRRTMLGMFIGGAIGAVFSGLMGVTYYLAGGAANFLVFTNYLQGGQMNTVWAIVGMAISFVIAAAVVFATGFSKEELAEMEA